MTKEEIIQMANQAKLPHDYVRGEPMWLDKLEEFAKLVAEKERDRIYAEELELPKPKLTGKFSITAGRFKCTGCTGTWINREDAKHHSCKDYAYRIAEDMLERRQEIINKWALREAIVDDGIERLKLTVRSELCLKREEIFTITQLIGCTKKRLLKTPNLGLKTINEIIEKLNEKGLKLRGQE